MLIWFQSYIAISHIYNTFWLTEPLSDSSVVSHSETRVNQIVLIVASFTSSILYLICKISFINKDSHSFRTIHFVFRSNMMQEYTSQITSSWLALLLIMLMLVLPCANTTAATSSTVYSTTQTTTTKDRVLDSETRLAKFLSYHDKLSSSFTNRLAIAKWNYDSDLTPQNKQLAVGDLLLC